MIQKSIFRVKKCYFHYDFACKKVPLSLRYAENEIEKLMREIIHKPKTIR
jgi:hypothetical protein